MAADAKLKAALTLRLDDLISPALKRLQQQLDALRTLVGRLRFDRFGDGADGLRATASAATGLSTALVRVDRAAAAAAASVRGMAAASTITVGANGVARIASAGAMVPVPLLAGGGGRGGVPGQLRLTGPGGSSGGIPLSGYGPGPRSPGLNFSGIGAAGTAVAGFSFLAPLRAAAEYDTVLRQTAITKGLSGPDAAAEVTRLGKLFNKEALETGQTNISVATAYKDLVQMGMSADLAERLIPIHSHAATAYDVTPEQMGRPVYALGKTLGISEADMPAALAAMAQATKEGQFKMIDMATYLPGVAAQFSAWGPKGKGAASSIFSGLEVIRQQTSDSQQASTYFDDLLTYFGSPFGNRTFARNGIDLRGSLRLAAKKGMEPFDAFMALVRTQIKGLNPEEARFKLGDFFHNQGAAAAALALLQNWDEFQAKRAKYNNVSPKQLGTDFMTVSEGIGFALKQMLEALHQVDQVMGKDFVPVLRLAIIAATGLRDGLLWMHETWPTQTPIIFAVVGGMLALATVMGVIGMLAPAVAGGFRIMVLAVQLLLSPVRLLATGLLALGTPFAVVLAVMALLALAAIDIYRHWDRFAAFFGEIGQGIMDFFGGLVDVIMGLLTADWPRMKAGFGRMATGIAQIFSGLWGVVRQLFIDFGDWVMSWAGDGAAKAVQAIKDAFFGLVAWFDDLWKRIRAPFDNLSTSVRSFQGGEGAGQPDASPARLGGPSQLNITLQAEPGTNITSAEHDGQPVTVRQAPTLVVRPRPDPGRVLNRP
jgi:TP901 family phage tail tape measure protein